MTVSNTHLHAYESTRVPALVQILLFRQVSRILFSSIMICDRMVCITLVITLSLGRSMAITEGQQLQH